MGGSSDSPVLSLSPSLPMSSGASPNPKSPGDSKTRVADTNIAQLIIPVDNHTNTPTIIQRNGTGTGTGTGTHEDGNDSSDAESMANSMSSSSSSSCSSSSASSPMSGLPEEKSDEGQSSFPPRSSSQPQQQPQQPSNIDPEHEQHMNNIHALLKPDSIYQMTKEEEELMERVGKGLKEGEVASQCLWVGNVDPEITQTEFRAVFEKYGPVQLIRLFPRSKCAFVTFQKPSHAIKALEMEGKQLGTMNLTLNVGKASRHLWVGNVGPNMSDAELQAAFAKFGTVESVRVLRANQCAFVNFSTEVEALRAAEEMNGTELGGQTIVINFQWSNSYKRPGKGAKPGSPENGPQTHARTGSIGGNTNGVPTASRTGKNTSPGSRSPERKPKTLGTANAPSRQLFVGNIVPNVTEETLWSLFSRFGELEQIKGFSGRGYAFVIYRSLRVAIWVRDQMTMYPPILGGRPLCVNFGKPPQDSPPGGTDDFVPDGMTVPLIQSQPMVPISPDMPYSTLYTPPNEAASAYSPELAYRSAAYLSQPTSEEEYSELAMQMNAMNLGIMNPHMYVPSSHAMVMDQTTSNGTEQDGYTPYQQQQAAQALQAAAAQQQAAQALQAAAAQQYAAAAMQQSVSPYGSPYQQYAHLAFSPLPALSPMLSSHHMMQMQSLSNMTASPQMSHRELTSQQTNRLSMLQAAALANTGIPLNKIKKGSTNAGTGPD